MQSLTVTGRLGRDIKSHTTSNGEEFYSLTLASNSNIKGVKSTTWYDVLAFNTNRVKNMIPYLKKGASVIVVGELSAKIENDTNGIPRMRLAISADRIDFNSTGERSNNSSDNPYDGQGTVKAKDMKPKANYVPEDIQVETAAQYQTPASTADDDDLPF